MLGRRVKRQKISHPMLPEILVTHTAARRGEVMGVNIGSSTNKFEGSPANGEYQGYGVGNTDEAYREATRKGMYPSDNTGPNRSQGESAGAGSIYSAMLNERPNLSNPRNRGPERAPSRSGAKAIPVVTVESRATGRLG